MTELQIRAVVAGVFFGIWPLLMNRSGLSGNLSAVVFDIVSLLFIFPFAALSFSQFNFAQVNWPFIICAGVAGGIGILNFNGGLAIVSKENVSTFFVLMMVVQVAVPSVYQFFNGEVSSSKLLGFVLAVGAAYFLSK